MKFKPSFKSELLNLVKVKLRSGLHPSQLTGEQSLMLAIVCSAFEDIVSNSVRPSEKYLAHQYLQDSWHAEALGLEKEYVKDLADKITKTLGMQAETLFQDHFTLSIKHLEL